MNFFDSLIRDVSLLTEKLPYKDFSCSDELWQDVGYSQVILQRDTAFELGGTGFNLVTSEPVSDGITLIGDDLDSIGDNRKFARVSLVQIEDEQDQQKAYNLIRKIEYVKYHHFPEGYMIRTSSRSHKEAVRVAKSAIKKGITFRKIGSLLINKYKENPAVKGVRVIYITAEDADYGKLEALAQKNNTITETLNHVMNSVKFDCDSCNLKPVCDEIEGMKELHFKSAAMREM
ncbi:MAG: hypothetical protein IJW86_01270 [Clostridia bacterium]|nr:hypothetical protein [Clostridia bacterium]